MTQFPPIPSWDALHPLIIHFPIALLLVVPFLIVVGALRSPERGRTILYVALALMIAGTLGTFLAVGTGEAAGRMAERTPQIDVVLEHHEQLAEATRIASRVGAVREAAGLTAYATGRWAQARSELRAARRLSGSDEFLPMIADCERGLGNPERALDLAGSPEAARLDKATTVELRIVASGARRDLGQLDAAVVTLQCPELRDESKPWSARLRYAYADALLAAGRTSDAVEWFERAAHADLDGETEAQERLDELSGLVFVDADDDDDASEDGASGVVGSAADGLDKR